MPYFTQTYSSCVSRLKFYGNRLFEVIVGTVPKT